MRRCGCGASEHNHFLCDDTSTPGQGWSKDAIKTIGPTNAFGVVKFYSGAQDLHKFAEFVRLSDDDDPLNVIELLDKHWNLLGIDTPLLCISVIGGTDRFFLEAKKRELFCEGLIRAVFSTNAWILTHGLDFGVVNVVSDAISKAESYHLRSEKMSKKIICIGIAPWGFVQDHDKLINLSYVRAQYLKYCIDYETVHDEAASLNKNHTHYIFVDNGFRSGYQCNEAWKFRKELEHLIATPRKGGEFDILEQAAQSAQAGVPIVICAGTGKAANILDRALNFWSVNRKPRHFSSSQISELREMLATLLIDDKVAHRDPSWTVDRGINLLEITMQHKDYVSSFNLDEEYMQGSFDRAILYALIKCATTNPIDQLMVALKFGRIDVVKEKILPDGAGRLRSSFKKYQLNRLMTAALLDNRSEFAEYLIEQGLVEMSTYLDVMTLTHLYNELDDPSVMRRCLKRFKAEVESTQPTLTRAALLVTTANVFASETETSESANKLLEMLIHRKKEKVQKEWINLPTVQRLLKKLLGSFNHPLYLAVTPFNRRILFPNPLQELFIWAVMNNRNELALIFWRNADDAVALSLIGCNLYKKLAHTLPLYDTEGRLALDNQKVHFEQTAKMMIDMLYSKSRWRALYLLIRPLRTWGHHSCMPLAMQADCREFISSIACQHAIRFEWRASVHANVFSLVLAYICPLFIFTPLIAFSSSSTPAKNTAEQDIVQRLKGDIKHANMHTDTNQLPVSVAKKVAIFYNAPRTKFCIHTVFYAIFLVFFSYTLLFGLKPDYVTILEAILMAYLGAFCVETVRSFIKMVREKDSVHTLLGSWLSNDKWHAYDAALMVASVVTVCLRFGWASTYIVAKSFYSILLIFYFLRLFQFFSVNHKLGPNSVVIFKMLVELSIFLFILLIFLLPYGISTQALLYPYMTDFDPKVLTNIFYYPYYRIYGELFLEQSEAQVEGCDRAKADGITCPMYNFLSPLFLAIYMLIVAVLLINLLIAIFRYKFVALFMPCFG
ncbi:unnamed protein product [Hydatigera taeniaeformis]|uniref:LSDAT_euk domain-containing protein n=1 Tax=Hydatigena taeniaeformis TaxID=6205 RepID=A0A0R3X961_HYDTA|nr:unnamed protein product [Hydatigera taeniaeformis]